MTSIVSLVANAGQDDQAIASAADHFPIYHLLFLEVQSNLKSCSIVFFPLSRECHWIIDGKHAYPRNSAAVYTSQKALWC